MSRNVDLFFPSVWASGSLAQKTRTKTNTAKGNIETYNHK